MAGQDFRKAKMARHASFNIAPTSVAVQRQVSSAPSSPRLEPMGKRCCRLYGAQLYSLLVKTFLYSCLTNFFPHTAALQNQPVDYSKRTSNGTVCRQFGNSTEWVHTNTHTHTHCLCVSWFRFICCHWPLPNSTAITGNPHPLPVTTVNSPLAVCRKNNKTNCSFKN